MTGLTGCAFAKMNGLGNEILVIDLRASDEVLTGETARGLAQRAELRFDQLMAIHRPRRQGVEADVLIYNADGSRAGACGNGARCVAWYLLRGSARDEVAFETQAGTVACRRVEEWRFAADMGKPRLLWDEIPVRDPISDTRRAPIALTAGDVGLGLPSLVSMGNPHAVFWVADFSLFDLASIGPRLELHPAFPERANISLARVASRELIELRVWERGAGLTQACGTAACAALVAASRLDFCDRNARVVLPGGELTIEWGADDHVRMTGPCALEWEGVLEAAILDHRADADAAAASHVAG